ncbi:hypothetical protein [Novosphingobium sp.]|uniref:hypothetical protein n=1 Tax=Novosphingobium sp. TaxID=1874826 RepID=UPI0025F6ADEF|nr:hypothetical protein [Novosphingobium sp.]MCC6926530.1 hypothetical protein [Novosphingobium sp.]
MKPLLLGLGAATILTGLAVPASAYDGTAQGDAVCIRILAEAAVKLKEKPPTYAVVMNFQGYYTARVRQAIGPKGDLAAALRAGSDVAGKMDGPTYKATGSKCLEGAAQKDLEELFITNDRLGANLADK